MSYTDGKLFSALSLQKEEKIEENLLSFVKIKTNKVKRSEQIVQITDQGRKMMVHSSIDQKMQSDNSKGCHKNEK